MTISIVFSETKKILQHKDMVSLEADKIMAAQFSSAKQATTNTAETIKTKGLKEWLMK